MLAAAPQAGRGDCGEQGGLSAAPQPLSTSAVIGKVPPVWCAAWRFDHRYSCCLPARWPTWGPEHCACRWPHGASQGGLVSVAMRCSLSCLHSGFIGWLEHLLLQGAGACLWSFGRVLTSVRGVSGSAQGVACQ